MSQEGAGDSTSQEVFGHRLMRQPRQTKMNGTPPTCEGCRKQVRGIIRQWYLCKSEYCPILSYSITLIYC